MKVLHLMQEEKFTTGVVGFYNEFFRDTHSVLYVSSKINKESHIRKGFLINQNEIVVSKYSLKSNYELFEICEQYDYIVLHALFLSNLTKILLITRYRNILKKIVWIEWGADLYSFKKEKPSIKNYLLNQLNYKVRNHIDFFVAIFPPDLYEYERLFCNTKVRKYCASYISYPFQKVEYKVDSKLKSSLESGDEIVIQIGQNGKKTLNHIQVLDELYKFKNENIKLLLPLSYGGEPKYAEKVAKYAKKLFGRKAVILKDFLPKDEYFNILNSVSIAIFHSYRQCALGNIHNLILNNAKVFLTGDGVMYDYFCQCGVPVQKYEDISQMSFDEFVQPVEITDYNLFEKYVEERKTKKDAILAWHNIYRDLERLLDFNE